MSMAYAMLNQGGVDELVLIDVLKDKAKGEEMDLSHGLPYAPQKMTIKAGDYSECKDANVVVITAGLPQKPGQSRLELAVANTKIVKEITEQVMASGFNGVFIIASNPVDLMSYVVSKVSGLPTSKVIGSGTVLDTARLRYLIAEYLDVSSKNVHAYILGEHGDSSFVPWEHCYVGCKKMVDIMETGVDRRNARSRFSPVTPHLLHVDLTRFVLPSRVPRDHLFPFRTDISDHLGYELRIGKLYLVRTDM